MKVYKVKTILEKDDTMYSSYNILAENMEEALKKWKSQVIEDEIQSEIPEEIEMITKISLIT